MLVPEGGIAPNEMFRVYEGGAYTNYVCDANGHAAFGVGSTSSTTTRAQFVTALSRESNVVTTLAQASYLRIAKTNGSATFYSLTTGEFAAYISTQNSLLTAQDAENYLSILRQEDGSIRQVWNLWDGLADIVPAETGGGYTIALYLPGQVTGNDPASGLYSVTGNPFKTFAVSGDAAAKTIIITERDLTLPDGMPPYVTTWEQEQDIWNIVKGVGEEAISTVREKTDLPENGTYRVVTTISKGGIAASIVAEEYLSHVTGELLLSRTDGHGSPEAQTTTYEYDDAGRVIRIIAPDGGETGYIHDAVGRIAITTTPWAGGKSRLVQTTYLDDESEYSNDPSQVDINFLTPAGIPQLHLRETYTYSTANQIRRIEKRSTANGITRLEITETWQGNAENPYARGRTRMTQQINGVQTWYDYAPATQHGALYCVTAETRINGELVAGHSMRNIRFITAQGNTVREEEWILESQGTWKMLSFFDDEFDMQNRRIKRTRSNGRTTTRILMCTGNILREMDEDGILTTYSYDSARQLVETIRSATPTTPETITGYTRDASGRALQTRTDIGAMATTKTLSYDLLGRIVEATDELGRKTSYAYSTDGLTTTMTTPSGSIFATTNNTDGSIAHESGTGQRELYHVYDYTGGRIRETVKLADQMTILSQTLQNGFGETVVVTSPTTIGYIYDRTNYNEKGQITQAVRDTGSGSGSVSMSPTLYEYNSFGNVIRETWKHNSSPTPVNSRITTYAYTVEDREDGTYRVTAITKNNAAGTTYTEISARLISESSLLENKLEETDPRGNTTSTWAEYGEGTIRLQKAQVPTSVHIASATIVDGFTTEQTNYAGITTTQTRTYTASGLIMTQTDGRSNTITTRTDIAGRTLPVTDAARNITATSYCSCCNNPSAITDAIGNTSHYRYDIRNRKTAEWGSNIQPAGFAYDDADRLIGLTTFREDAGDITTDPTDRGDGDVTTWEYHDATGFEIRKTYADGTAIRREYNALGLLGHLHNARGNNASYIYNTNTGTLKIITHTDGTAAQNFTYNQLAHLKQITDASGTRTFEYNEYDELTSEVLNGDSVTHLVTETQDAYGRNTGYGYAKGGAVQQTVSIEYGTDGRLSAAGFLHAGVPQKFSYGYLPGSLLLHTLSHPNNILITRAYEDHRDLVTSMHATRGATNVVLRGYTYDQLGRPVTRTCSRRATTRNDSFGYNERSELTSASLGTNPYSYAYDNIGNRKTAQEIAEEISYDANSINQYTSIARNETAFVPTFDTDGNQTLVQTSTGIWAVVYNADNRPISFTKTEGDQTTLIECSYDYMSRRSMKKVTLNGTLTLHHRYIYRGYLQIACVDLARSTHPALWLTMWDPSEPVATRPLAIQKNATWYTFGHDLTKNVTELYKTDGTIATAYDYTPYGAVTATGIDQPFQWSSEVFDAEFGMVYYNYRHYNPSDGRWINRDPIAEQGGANLYGFVENKPLWKGDLSGLVCQVTYSIKLHRITARKNKSGTIDRFTTENVFSGNSDEKNNPDFSNNQNSGPIPPGNYYIIKRQSGGIRDWARNLVNDRSNWLALIAIDDSIDDKTEIDGVVRSSFRMHAGESSLGCITFMNEAVFEAIREFILDTDAAKVDGTDYIYYGILEVNKE